MKLYSYVLRVDDGAAPNPFGGFCTLAICKPAIRRVAQIGDWVIGTGSKSFNYPMIQECLIYAMKISDIKSLEEYDVHCRTYLPNKIPKWRSKKFEERIGDCIYDFSAGEIIIRESVHKQENMAKDLRGRNVLISNHFYYFGSEPPLIPVELKTIIKRNQGHKKILSVPLIESFENWISQFELNRLYGNPQLEWKFLKSDDSCESLCSERLQDDIDESEEVLC